VEPGSGVRRSDKWWHTCVLLPQELKCGAHSTHYSHKSLGLQINQFDWLLVEEVASTRMILQPLYELIQMSGHKLPGVNISCTLHYVMQGIHSHCVRIVNSAGFGILRLVGYLSVSHNGSVEEQCHMLSTVLDSQQLWA